MPLEYESNKDMRNIDTQKERLQQSHLQLTAAIIEANDLRSELRSELLAHQERVRTKLRDPRTDARMRNELMRSQERINNALASAESLRERLLQAHNKLCAACLNLFNQTNNNK